MARKKVSLMRIANTAARRATFKKRRQGLIKKAQELSILCAVKACVVVYGEGESQPEVWPSATDVTSILKRYDAMPNLHQYKKTMNQVCYLQERINKLQEQLQKCQRENHERETKLLLHDVIVGRRGINDLSIEEITNLGWMVEMRITSVRDRINQFHGQAKPKTQLLMSDLALAPVSSLPPMPYIATNNMDMHTMKMDHVPNQQGCLMDMANIGGGINPMVFNGFFSRSEASTSAGGNMLEPSNLDASFAWPGPRNSFNPM